MKKNTVFKSIIALIMFSFSFGHLRSNYILALSQTPQELNCLSKTIVLDLALSPDGKSVLAVPADIHEVWLWDMENGKQIWSFQNKEADSSEITSVAFSPNGKYFLVSDLDKAIVWDSSTFAQVGIFPRPKRAFRYTAAVFLPDSEHILVSGASDGVQLWEIASQELIHSFPGVTQAILSPDGNYILVSQDEKSWDLWNIWDDKKLYTFPVVVQPHFSPDSKWVATYDEKNGLIVSALQNPKTTKFVLPPQAYPSGWAFSLDGKYILNPEDSSTYILVEIDTGKIAHTFTDFHPSNWHFGSNSFLEIEVASSTEVTTKVRIWKLSDFSLDTDATIDTGKITIYDLSNDGKYLLTTSDTKGYLLWNMDTLQVVSRFC